MKVRNLIRVAALGAALSATAGTTLAQELLNVSYDPTRELWRDINASFIPNYEKQAAGRSPSSSRTAARARRLGP